MGAYRAVLIPGDGIGPEVTEAARRVIAASGIAVEWEVLEVGEVALGRHGDPLPEEVLERIRECGVALKGPVTTPVGEGFPSVNVALRQRLGLYANLRPVRSIPGLPSLYGDVDLVIVRENTEGLYVGIEVSPRAGVVEAVRRITAEASLRIARFAFAYAARNGRRSVTAVHKANILKGSDGLFLDCARWVAADYPGIEYRERIVDAACLDLVLDPSRHDVLLCPNLYGDIISDLAAGLVGGLGLVPAANLGDGVGVFEAAHGSAPDIAGRGIANPTALILAGAMLLDHLGEGEAGRAIEAAVAQVYREGKCRTPDLGGASTTREFAGAVIAALGDG